MMSQHGLQCHSHKLTARWKFGSTCRVQGQQNQPEEAILPLICMQKPSLKCTKAVRGLDCSSKAVSPVTIKAGYHPGQGVHHVLVLTPVQVDITPLQKPCTRVGCVSGRRRSGRLPRFAAYADSQVCQSTILFPFSLEHGKKHVHGHRQVLSKWNA